ncbi:MAG: hypothetical protein AAF939_01600 [Planctomycetota bacterium]
MSDSENNSSEEPIPRFNRGAMYRIIAVSVFILLSTFAVMQTLYSNKGQDSQKQVALKPDSDTSQENELGKQKNTESGQSNATNHQAEKTEKTKFDFTRPNLNDPASKNFSSEKPGSKKPSSKKPGFGASVIERTRTGYTGSTAAPQIQRNSSGPPATRVTPPKSTTNNLLTSKNQNSGSSFLPPSRSFDSDSNAFDSQSPKSFSDGTSKPPVRRFAQNSGIPAIPSQNGFGIRETASGRINELGNDVSQKLDGVSGKLTAKAGSVSRGLQEKADSIIQGTSNLLKKEIPKAGATTAKTLTDQTKKLFETKKTRAAESNAFSGSVQPAPLSELPKVKTDLGKFSTSVPTRPSNPLGENTLPGRGPQTPDVSPAKFPAIPSGYAAKSNTGDNKDRFSPTAKNSQQTGSSTRDFRMTGLTPLTPNSPPTQPNSAVMNFSDRGSNSVQNDSGSPSMRGSRPVVSNLGQSAERRQPQSVINSGTGSRSSAVPEKFSAGPFAESPEPKPSNSILRSIRTTNSPTTNSAATDSRMTGSESQTNVPNRPSSKLPLDSSITSNLTKDIPGDRQLEGAQAPALIVEKLAPKEVQVNSLTEFELVIRNVGNVTARNVIVLDRIPNGAEFMSALPQATVSRTRDLKWELGSLRPGQESRIKVQLKPTQPGEIGSVATVISATSASMRTRVTRPILNVVHQSKPTYLVGDNVVFDVVVQNKGDGPANKVLIQEDVPRQLEFSEGYRELEYDVGTLMPGQSKRIQLSLRAAKVGKLQNVMYASAEGGLRAQHKLDLEIIAPKLVASSSGPTKRFLGRKATHVFTVANKGTAKATNVELIARLPSGLKYKASNNQGRYDPASHAVYWSMAELSRGVDATVELTTTPVDIGSQAIRFESFADLDVRADAQQPLSVQHLDDVFFDIDDVVDPIEIGAETGYRIRIVNQGTQTATNVQIQVDFPAGIQPTAVEGTLRHSIAGQRITFEPITSMSPRDELSFVIKGTGKTPGDHRVVVNLKTDGRTTSVAKQESTRVYSDR